MVERGEQMGDPVAVQAGRGFVEDEHLGPHGQDAGDRHPLLLPGTQHVNGTLGQVLDPHRGEGVFHALARLGFREIEVERAERDVLIDVSGEQLVVGILKDEADGCPPPLQRAPVPRGRTAVQQQVAGGGAQRSVEMQEKRGLARPVGPEDREPPAARHVQVEPLEGLDPAGIRVMQAARGEDHTPAPARPAASQISDTARIAPWSATEPTAKRRDAATGDGSTRRSPS